MQYKDLIKKHWATGVLTAIALAYLGYLLLRLLRIPMTQDEVATCYNHVIRKVFDIILYSKEAVPNNHILNTLSIKLLSGIFGMGREVARTPAYLIGGLGYTLAAFGLARQLGKTGLLQVCFFIILLANPFVAEFFSLARGYGMSVGLLLGSIYFSWLFLQKGLRKHLIWAIVLSSLAVWASFTVLYVYLAWWLYMALHVWQRDTSREERLRFLKDLVVGGGVLALVCFLPIYRMQASEQLVFWGATGFYKETVRPLIQCSIMGHPYLDQFTLDGLTGLITAFFAGASAFAIWRWRQNNWQTGADPIIFPAFLLTGTVVINLHMAYLLDVPFMNPRTALFYYPLFAFLLIGTAATLWERYEKPALWFIIPLTIFAFSNFNNNRNFKQSYEWAYDRGATQILDFIAAAYQAENRTELFTLDCNWLHQNSLNFHREFDSKGYTKWISMPNFYHGNEPPRGDTDFYYTAEPYDFGPIKDNYEAVLTIEPDKYVLMRRKRTE